MCDCNVLLQSRQQFIIITIHRMAYATTGRWCVNMTAVPFKWAFVYGNYIDEVLLMTDTGESATPPPEFTLWDVLFTIPSGSTTTSTARPPRLSTRATSSNATNTTPTATAMSLNRTTPRTPTGNQIMIIRTCLPADDLIYWTAVL